MDQEEFRHAVAALDLSGRRMVRNGLYLLRDLAADVDDYVGGRPSKVDEVFALLAAEYDRTQQQVDSERKSERAAMEDRALVDPEFARAHREELGL